MSVHPRHRHARRAFYNDLTVEPGLPGSAKILTVSGQVAVQDLEPGDRIITRQSGASRLLGLACETRLTQVVAFHRLAVEGAGGLITTILPADQPVFLRDWRAQAMFGAKQALVAAHRLVDEEFVTHRIPKKMTLFNLHFEGLRIVYVEGMELAAGGLGSGGTHPTC